MSNLLNLNPLTTVQELAEVYVVYNNQDYRMTLATLVSLVTKARLGLDRVNNTSDLEKPISQAVAAALASKADSDNIVSLAAFQQLADSLQNYVSLDTLNTAIGNLQTTLQSYATKTELETAVAAAATPLQTSIQQLSDDLQAQALRITALEKGSTGGGITQAELDAGLQQAIDAAKAYTDQVFSPVNTSLQSLQTQVTGLNQALGALAGALAGKADANHRHTLADIDGLPEAIDAYLAQAGVVIELSPSDW